MYQDVRRMFILDNILYDWFEESAGLPLKRGCNFAYRAIKVGNGSRDGMICENDDSFD